MPEDNADVTILIAIGRIEEGMRFMRESQERMERKLDSQDSRINEIELDVKELKTHRENKGNIISLTIAVFAVIISAASLLIP